MIYSCTSEMCIDVEYSISENSLTGQLLLLLDCRFTTSTFFSFLFLSLLFYTKGKVQFWTRSLGANIQHLVAPRENLKY